MQKLLLFSALIFTILFTEAQEKPNIVLFFVDDWAWNGSTVQMDDEVASSYISSILEMPNLEKLATEGMIFSNAYSGAPQCSPSRVALQTGQSSPRNGFTVYMNNNGDYYDNNSSYSQFPVIPNISDETIDPDATTIPEALAPHGYASAHIGKWHMRGHPDDEGYVMNDGNTTNTEGNQRIPEDPKLMFSITDSAFRFITEQVHANRPFYAQLSHYAMHAGSECLAETRARYQAMPELQLYYKENGVTPETVNEKSDPATWLGMAEDLDGRIGAVLDTLKKLGVYDNTYIIVTGDNGYRNGFYDDLLRLPQPLHSAKWWLWQGGLRVPMIAVGPGIPADTVCDENVVNYDFLPTFIEWAGGDPATELTDIDGISLASLMSGLAASPDFSNRTLYFHYPHYRSGMPHSVAVAGDRKVVHFYEQPGIPMYFDIQDDIGEVSNIAEKDVAGHQALFDDMMGYLTAVGARFPLYPNPAYDSLVYMGDPEYEKRVLWGPFTGDREPEKDEIITRGKKLYQHLSAINKYNLSTDGSGVITLWKDLSIHENNALPGMGNAIFPSLRLLESGLPGIDLGSSNTNLELFSSSAAGSLLDFNGTAGKNDGFALTLAFNPNALPDEWCYLAGNSTDRESLHSFGLRYNGAGLMEAYLGGHTIQGSKALSASQTSVVVINYNKNSGKFEMYTSLGDTLSTQVNPGDFSNSSALYFGGISSESTGFFDGIVGEIKVYNMALTEEQSRHDADEVLENWTSPAEQLLWQHLDASVEGSVDADASGIVSRWTDLSGNENPATPETGVSYYPSSSLSATGLPGIDLGSSLNKLELFSAEESDALLDFNGLAAKNNGVSIFVTFRIDSLASIQNDILGNSTSTGSGLGMRIGGDADPIVYLGGTKLTAGKKIQKDETVVYAVNYDKNGKLFTFWNSAAGSSISAPLAPGDFSNDNRLTVGACDGKSRFLRGMVGEVKVYNYSLGDNEFNQQCKWLEDKWINGIQPTVYRIKDPFSKSGAGVAAIYPNPVSDEITIEGMEKGRYIIYDMLGNRLIQGELKRTINVSGLSNGLYFLNLNDNIMKFIKTD